MRVTKNVITQYRFMTTNAADLAYGLRFLEKAGVNLTGASIEEDDIGGYVVTTVKSTFYDESTIHKMEA